MHRQTAQHNTPTEPRFFVLGEYPDYMPEGPEIRRAADRIAKRLVGREIEAIELHYPPIREFQSVVSDSQVVSVASRGKAMLTRFDCDLSMYSHNQLYGRWTVNRRSTELKWGRAHVLRC